MTKALDLSAGRRHLHPLLELKHAIADIETEMCLIFGGGGAREDQSKLLRPFLDAGAVNVAAVPHRLNDSARARGPTPVDPCAS